MVKRKIKGRACIVARPVVSNVRFYGKKDILTVEELAQYTGYSESYVYKLCHHRRIPHYNNEFGRRLFFVLDEIKEWCTANRVKTVSEIIKN